MPEANNSPVAEPSVAPAESKSQERYLSSRKFIMTAIAHAINLYMTIEGMLTPKDAMNNVLILTSIYVVGNALGDLGSFKMGGNAGLDKILGSILDLTKKDGSK